MVAQVWEVQCRVAGAGRHIGKGQILHVWGDGGKGKRCGGAMSGQGALQAGSRWVVLVWERLNRICGRDVWIDERR